MKTRRLLCCALLTFVLIAAPAHLQAQENDAKAILKTMSDYVGSEKTIQLAFDSDIEIITPQDSKTLDPNTLIELDELPPGAPQGGNP